MGKGSSIAKTSPRLTDFSVAVMDWIRKIPKGRVATYGQIAELAGKPNGSRGVAWILHSCATTHRLPWHRVVGSPGRIAFPREASNYLLQKRRLREEGVEFLDGDRIDLVLYQWKKKARKKKSSGLRLFRS